ncbi:MAG: hypothetical protein ACK4RW_01415 [Rehaibacterium terrae]|uniref:hypothetical protein n=1 Tax=Rehaibacterium terrae TaxID=1341696 RepID=UPI00391C4B46
MDAPCVPFCHAVLPTPVPPPIVFFRRWFTNVLSVLVLMLAWRQTSVLQAIVALGLLFYCMGVPAWLLPSTVAEGGFSSR